MILHENAILITGGSGALGTAIVRCCEDRGIPYLAPTHQELDVTRPDDVRDYVLGRQVSAIIHSAAIVDWVKVHNQPQEALNTNCNGSINVAKVASEIDAHLVYVSTDAVFPGVPRAEGYNENDNPRNPVSFYGMTKLMGEWACNLYSDNLTITRLGWLFGPDPEKDQKFVGLMVKQIAEGKKDLIAVDDKVGSPSYAPHVASRIVEFAQRATGGIRHVVNNGIASRYDVARAVVGLWGNETVTVSPVKSDAFPSVILRPDYSGLSTIYNDAILPDWHESLKEYHSNFPVATDFTESSKHIARSI